MTKNKKILFFLTALGGVIIVFVGGFLAGSVFDLRRQLASGESVDINEVIDLYSKTRSTSVSFEQFWDIWNEVKSSYVDQPVSEVDLFYGALSGMVAGLKDPYSVYFPPVEAQEFATDLSGHFDGIGAEIGIKDEDLIVIAPLPESPAEKAGLRPGDRILAIDGEGTRGITVEAAVKKIRGPKDTSVTLSVAKVDQDVVEEITITRGKITIESVVYEVKDNNIAYLRIAHFSDDTLAQFNQAVEKILAQKPVGLVLDMRSNPGGYLETSVQVASEWVAQDRLVVRQRVQNKEILDYTARGQHRLAGIPTVVLVDEGTASGSEIVAGALQDHGIAKLIGKKTFGKGSVQDFRVLPDGSALKITTAKWFTPNDKAIDKEGIMPDIMIEGDMFVEDTKAKNGVRDVGLEKAIEVLLQK